MVDRLYASAVGRWIVVASNPQAAGGPPDNPLPWFEMRAPRVADGVAYEVSLVGSDGCNWVGVDATVDDRGVLGDVRGESTAVLCDPPGAAVFTDGTRLTWLDSDRLSFTTAAGASYTFAPLDTLGTRASSTDDLVGEWAVATSPAFSMSFGPGWLAVRGCRGSWHLDEGALAVEWDGDPYTCLIDTASGANLVGGTAGARLVEALSAPDAALRRAGDDLYLTTDQLAFAFTRTGEPLDPDALALASGSVFGLRAGDTVDVEWETARLTRVLGAEPTLDTGWYPVPDETPADGTEDCIGGPDYRVLWWGDLRLAFWRQPDTGRPPALWNWSVGDRDVMWFGKSEPDPQPVAPPSGLDSGLGFAVGDPAAVLDPASVFLQATSDDGIDRYVVMGPTYATIGVRDGVIVGFGSQLVFC